MIERPIIHAAIEWPDATETAAEARVRLAAKFPRNALRRMTHLGMLVGSSLEGVTLGVEDAVVYASTFAETRALEDYLDGLPDASPMLFQTSIHPGAVQQALIARQQSIARLWPNAGGARIVEDALLCALLEPARKVVLVAGEERGTWMLDHGMAASRPFAAALVFGWEADDAIGRVQFRPGGTAVVEGCPSLEEWVKQLQSRQSIEWQGTAGRWKIDWR